MSALEAAKPRDPLTKLRIERLEERRRAPRAWGWVWGLLVLLAIAGAAAGGFIAAERNGWLAVPEALQPRAEVRVASVTVETGRSADALVVASGYLESRRQAMIGARAPGRIEVIHFEEGTRVKHGQVLAVLEHADMDAALAAMRATLDRSKAEVDEQEIVIQRTERAFGRAQKLHATRTITETEYDVARFDYEGAVARLESLKAAVALAEARVREAEQLKENMFVRAPFDGTVISKDAEVGESILPGGMGEASGRGSVLTIADLEHLEVDCDVKEDYISRVAVGQAAEVVVDAVPDRRYQGRVRKIIPMGDRARATIKVKVEIIDVDERLFPDMSSMVYFLPSAVHEAIEPDQRRVYGPTSAIATIGGETCVWVVDDDSRVQRAAVVAGPVKGDRTEIVKGLSGGERVVIDPPKGLAQGQLVKLVE